MNKVIKVPEQFNELFDQWAASYDDTVHGNDEEYRDVFKNYETILDAIVQRSHGFVVEFGVGTGNLTKKLIDNGLEVVGIEPSTNMRKIAQYKLPDAIIQKGNFLSFPSQEKKIDSIVSSYAFHHLTDEEKEQAIRHYREILNNGGKIVFGDTIFENDAAREAIYLQAKNNNYHRLAEDLNTEFYTTIPQMKQILENNGFTSSFEQMNDFVWIMEARLVD